MRRSFSKTNFKGKRRKVKRLAYCSTCDWSLLISKYSNIPDDALLKGAQEVHDHYQEGHCHNPISIK
jgi:hypothetical protein